MISHVNGTSVNYPAGSPACSMGNERLRVTWQSHHRAPKHISFLRDV